MASPQSRLGRASQLIQQMKQALFDAGEQVTLEKMYQAGSGAFTGTEYWGDVGSYLVVLDRSPVASRLGIHAIIDEIIDHIEQGTNVRVNRSIGTAEVFGAGGSITTYPANTREDAVHAKTPIPPQTAAVRDALDNLIAAFASAGETQWATEFTHARHALPSLLAVIVCVGKIRRSTTAQRLGIVPLVDAVIAATDALAPFTNWRTPLHWRPEIRNVDGWQRLYADTTRLSDMLNTVKTRQEYTQLRRILAESDPLRLLYDLLACLQSLHTNEYIVANGRMAEVVALEETVIAILNRWHLPVPESGGRIDIPEIDVQRLYSEVFALINELRGFGDLSSDERAFWLACDLNRYSMAVDFDVDTLQALAFRLWSQAPKGTTPRDIALAQRMDSLAIEAKWAYAQRGMLTPQRLNDLAQYGISAPADIA
jgi:hypothetical protein